jgi:hypothetical protein
LLSLLVLVALPEALLLLLVLLLLLLLLPLYWGARLQPLKAVGC